MPFSSATVRAATAAVALSALGSAAALPTVGEISQMITKRGVQSPIAGTLPSCNSQATDPSWAVGVSAFTDGQGTVVGNDCDNGMGGDSHCWTDYFIVGTTGAYQNWVQGAGNIQCPAKGDGSCTQSVNNIFSHCESVTWGGSAQISGEWETKLGKFGVTLGGEGGKTVQTCNGNITQSSCMWTDGGCHSIWGSYLTTTIHGYTRRTCASPTADTSSNMPNTPKRPDGYYTRGMLDFQFDLPDVTAVQCEDTCDSTFNPGALPTAQSGGALVPWTN